MDIVSYGDSMNVLFEPVCRIFLGFSRKFDSSSDGFGKDSTKYSVLLCQEVPSLSGWPCAEAATSFHGSLLSKASSAAIYQPLTQWVKIKCHFGIGAQKPCMVWVLRPSSMKALSLDPLGNAARKYFQHELPTPAVNARRGNLPLLCYSVNCSEQSCGLLRVTLSSLLSPLSSSPHRHCCCLIKEFKRQNAPQAF